MSLLETLECSLMGVGPGYRAPQAPKEPDPLPFFDTPSPHKRRVSAHLMGKVVRALRKDPDSWNGLCLRIKNNRSHIHAAIQKLLEAGRIEVQGKRETQNGRTERVFQVTR